MSLWIKPKSKNVIITYVHNSHITACVNGLNVEIWESERNCMKVKTQHSMPALSAGLHIAVLFICRRITVHTLVHHGVSPAYLQMCLRRNTREETSAFVHQSVAT